jgi:hypothetical protein
MFCLLDRWWKRTVNLMTDRVVPATGTFANLHLEEDHAPATSRLASVVKHEHKTDDHR